MRMIPNNGDRRMDWAPQDVVKTASSNGGEAEESVEVDALYEAAKKVVAGLDCFEEEGCGDEEVGGDDFGDDGGDGVEFSAEVDEVSESTGDEKAVECLEEAKDAIEDAVEALGGGTDEVELEVEIEEDVVEVDIVDDDIVAEGAEGCSQCGAAPTTEATTEASTDDEGTVESATEEMAVEASTDGWVKLSAISPKNRKAIYDYWSKQLDYPNDFVKLMVKDYE